MALNLFSSIVSSLADQATFVATSELDGKPMWPLLKIQNVEIDGSTSQTDQPLSNVQYNDDGTYTDLQASDVQAIKIISPSRVRITSFCSDLSTIENIMGSFADVHLTLSINSKSIIIPHLALSNISIEQNSNMLSAAEISMELEQAQVPFVPTYDPLQAGDVSTYGIHIQTLNLSLSATLTSLASKVAQKIIPTAPPVIDALLGSLGEPFVLGAGASKLS